MDIFILCARYAIAYTLLVSCLYAAWQCARAWQQHHLIIFQVTHVLLVLIGGIGYLAILRWDDAILYGAILAAGALYTNHYTNTRLKNSKKEPIDASHLKYRTLWLAITIPCLIILTGLNIAFSIYIRHHEEDRTAAALAAQVETLNGQTKIITEALQQIASDSTVIQAPNKLNHSQLTSFLQEQAVRHNLGFINLISDSGVVVTRSNQLNNYGDSIDHESVRIGIAYSGTTSPIIQASHSLHASDHDYTLLAGNFLDQDYLQHNLSNFPSVAIADNQGILNYFSSKPELRQLLTSQEFLASYLQTRSNNLSRYTLTIGGIPYLVVCQNLTSPGTAIPLTLITVSPLPQFRITPKI